MARDGAVDKNTPTTSTAKSPSHFHFEPGAVKRKHIPHSPMVMVVAWALAANPSYTGRSAQGRQMSGRGVVGCVPNTEGLPHKPATCTTDSQLVHRLGIIRSASSYGTLSLEKEGGPHASSIQSCLLFSTDFPVFWPAPFVMSVLEEEKKQG